MKETFLKFNAMCKAMSRMSNNLSIFLLDRFFPNNNHLELILFLLLSEA